MVIKAISGNQGHQWQSRSSVALTCEGVPSLLLTMIVRPSVAIKAIRSTHL